MWPEQTSILTLVGEPCCEHKPPEQPLENVQENEAATIAQDAIIDGVYDRLLDHFGGIKHGHVAKLCREAFTNKRDINAVLGLNEQNAFRCEIPIAPCQENFSTLYPKTSELFGKLADGKAHDVIQNTISIGKNQNMRFTRYLAQNKAKVEDLKPFYEHTVCEELSIKTLDDLSIFRDKIKAKRCVISTNPFDFMTASQDSSFSSCYGFDGEYFNSTLALCRQAQAAMVFLYDKDIAHKIGRAWVYLFPEQRKFIMLEPYGSFYEAEQKGVREAIEQKLSDHFGLENRWKKSVIDRYENHSGAQSPVYFDASNVTFVCHINADEEHEPIDLPEARCLYCGTRTDNAKNASCDDCVSDYTCEDCGHGVSSDDVRSYDGYNYCDDCFCDRYFYCNYCDEHYPNNEAKYVDGHGSCCNDCYDEKFVRCEECDKDISKKSGLYYVSDITEDTYCEDCYHDRFTRCYHCDDETELSDAVEHEHESYCANCSKEHLKADKSEQPPCLADTVVHEPSESLVLVA